MTTLQIVGLTAIATLTFLFFFVGSVLSVFLTVRAIRFEIFKKQAGAAAVGAYAGSWIATVVGLLLSEQAVAKASVTAPPIKKNNI